MPPSAPTPDAPPVPACFAVLDEIERRWRDALALVHSGDVVHAEREVETAGGILARLGAIEHLRGTIDASRLADFATRMATLSALHRELTEQSRRAQESIVRALSSTRQGRTALKAYGSRGPQRHACDEVG